MADENKPAKPDKPAKPARAKPRTIEELKALVLQGREEIVLDPKEVEAKIFDRMMSASTPEEALGASKATSAKDVLGKNLNVSGVNFLESDKGDGLGIYAVMDCTIDGQPHAVTCGARTVVAQLLKFDFEGWFPARVKLFEAKTPTKDGFFPMELTPGDPIEEPF